MLSKVVSSTIFWVFGMTWPDIEPKSPRPLANILTIMPMSGRIDIHKNNVGILNRSSESGMSTE